MKPSIEPERDADRPIDPDDRDAVPWRDLARRLVVFAQGLGASLEEAEDVVQDALHHVAANPDWFDPQRGTLSSVLKTVVRNAWSNRRRHRSVQRRAAPTLALVHPHGAAPDRALQADEASTQRHRVLSLLEPEERATFQAWLVQRARQVDACGAARSLGMTVAAYEAAKKRLRRRIRAALAELRLTSADLYDPPSESK